MSHMQPEILIDIFQIIHDTKEGDICAPLSYAEFTEKKDAAKAYNVPIENVEHKHGWGARLSAPGYLDATEWAVFDTKQEAAQYLLEMYGNDDEPEDWQAALENFIGG